MSNHLPRHQGDDMTTADPYGYIRNAGAIEEAVFLAIGAASTCWENLAGAGVFQSERAEDIAKALLDRIEATR